MGSALEAISARFRFRQELTIGTMAMTGAPLVRSAAFLGGQRVVEAVPQEGGAQAEQQPGGQPEQGVLGGLRRAG